MPAEILTAERLSAGLLGEVRSPRDFLVALYPDLAGVVPPMTTVVATARPLAARVNHGVWIASCDCGARRDTIPTPGGVVFVETPLVWCLRCRNGATGRGWRPVTVPPPELRTALEAVLLCRPEIADRNWEPTETLSDLLAQNLEHGDAIPGEA